MGFGASFDKEGISCPHWGLNPWPSSLQQVATPTALSSPVSKACKPAHTSAFTCCCILILIPQAGLLRAFMCFYVSSRANTNLVS